MFVPVTCAGTPAKLTEPVTPSVQESGLVAATAALVIGLGAACVLVGFVAQRLRPTLGGRWYATVRLAPDAGEMPVMSEARSSSNSSPTCSRALPRVVADTIAEATSAEHFMGDGCDDDETDL